MWGEILNGHKSDLVKFKKFKTCTDTHYFNLETICGINWIANEPEQKRQRNSDFPFLIVLVQPSRSLGGRNKSCFILEFDQFNPIDSSVDEPSSSYHRWFLLCKIKIFWEVVSPLFFPELHLSHFVWLFQWQLIAQYCLVCQWNNLIAHGKREGAQSRGWAQLWKHHEVSFTPQISSDNSFKTEGAIKEQIPGYSSNDKYIGQALRQKAF